MEVCFNNYKNKESRKGVGEERGYIMHSMHCRKLQGFALKLHHETLKSKITRNKERKEDAHFTFKLCHKMLNLKAKSHKEQDRKESSIEHTLYSKLCHEMLKLTSSISIQQSDP